jgi:hypothetical protein
MAGIILTLSPAVAIVALTVAVAVAQVKWHVTVVAVIVVEHSVYLHHNYFAGLRRHFTVVATISSRAIASPITTATAICTIYKFRILAQIRWHCARFT